jgi:tetrahydromethanopterin S-methyltransferase subunit F
VARRIVNIKNNKDGDNPIKAVGLTAIAAINAKEDIRDLLSIVGNVKSKAPKDYYAKYGFFVGTTVEEVLKKFDPDFKFLKSTDITVGEWPIIIKLFDKLKINPDIATAEKTVKHILKQEEALVRNYVHLEGGTKVTRLIGYALHRMPQLSLLTSGLLELPSVFKAKKKDKLKQVINSTLNVICGATFGAFFSASVAILVPKMIGLPIMALGVGYYLGSKIAKALGLINF